MLPAPDTFIINNDTFPGFNDFDQLDGNAASSSPPSSPRPKTNQTPDPPPLTSYSATSPLQLHRHAITPWGRHHVHTSICLQTFKQFLYPRALGAQITIDGIAAPVICTVKGFHPDPTLFAASEDYTPAGLLFDPPAGCLFATPFEGNPALVAPLVKDGDTIALLSSILQSKTAIIPLPLPSYPARR
ncbi:hypothetical protein Barb6XT_01348 [Bacteroidales bacterium Barb6XT]|nr:hypothetical protein Barb6XT_01348 [Bacteroidales bacterium Barb6XT]